MLQLRFCEREIEKIGSKYEYPRNEAALLGLRDDIRGRGFLSKDELNLVANWKSPRSAGHVEKNPPGFVEEVTSCAFKAKSERARIEILTILDGVSWPTASVILHLFHENKYPILDFRALWSASTEVPAQYRFSFWWAYVEFCRAIAGKNRVDMRTLDRAMWQYSKENQLIV